MIRMNLPTLARENQDRFSSEEVQDRQVVLPSAEVQDLQDQAAHLVRQDPQDLQAVEAAAEAAAAELDEEADKN